MVKYGDSAASQGLRMKKSERIYWLVNSLATEIEDGAKASKQIKRLVVELRKVARRPSKAK